MTAEPIDLRTVAALDRMVSAIGELLDEVRRWEIAAEQIQAECDRLHDLTDEEAGFHA